MTQPVGRLASIFRSKLSTSKSDPLTHITTILTTHPHCEPHLNRVSYLLKPRTASYLLARPPTLKSGFRFFLWATNHRFLKPWTFRDLVLHLLSSHQPDSGDSGSGSGFELFWETLEDMKKCEVNIPSEAFSVLISAYDKVGQADKAVATFGKMKDFDCKPDVFTFNAILNVMVRKNGVLLALDVYNQMLKSNCAPTAITYSILIDAFCKSGNLQDALHLFDEMTQRRILPNTVIYTSVLLGLCQAERLYDAIDLLNKMGRKRCLPDTVTWDCIVDGFCKMGKVDEAIMLSKMYETQGYVLGAKGRNCIIDGLFRLGRAEDAENWFQILLEDAKTWFCKLLEEKENIVPSVVMCTILIRDLCEGKRFKDACKVFQHMADMGVIPDTLCYNMLIKGFCDAGLLKRAHSLKLEISKNDCFPDTDTHTILICCMCKKGIAGESKQIFEEMEKHGCLPSVVTFNALINGLCKADGREEAQLRSYQMEIGRNVRNPSLFLRLSQGSGPVMDKAILHDRITSLCEYGLSYKAYTLLKKFTANGVVPNIATYNVLINGLCQSGNMNVAFKIFKKLQLKGESHDLVTYGTLIDGFYNAHRDEEALGMVDDMIHNGISPDSSIYRLLMTWACRRKKVGMCFTLWMDYLIRIKNLDNDVVRVIEERFEKGYIQEAVGSLLEIDIKMEDDFDLWPYTLLLTGFCQDYKVDEAMQIVLALHESNITVPLASCEALIEASCTEKRVGVAADVFEYALEKGYAITPQNCNWVFCLMFRSDPHVSRAISLVNKVIDTGYDMNDFLYPKAKALWQYHIAMQCLRDIDI